MSSTSHTYNLRDRTKIKKTIKEEVKTHMYNLRQDKKKDYTIFFTDDKEDMVVKFK
tara:strand:+ start:81 stop:248 length:168 start_codon:yes stop_codon:yes gene_type:complete